MSDQGLGKTRTHLLRAGWGGKNEAKQLVV